MRDQVRRWLAHGAVAAIAAAALQPAAAAAEETEVIFRASCGDLKGHRVDMDPTNPGEAGLWRPELYRAGPPPEGQGTLEFVSDDAHTDSIRVAWGGDGRFLPIVYKGPAQISVADVDQFGVWIFTLFFQAEKVVISRQTVGPSAGAVGAIVQGSCDLQPE